MDPQTSAPPVVAVVVTCNPGFWLEETLTALGSQDYPNLSVLVIDAASTQDPTPRVAAVLPGAYVRRLHRRVGFSRASNEVLSIVEGASHYLFCHDDVAPSSDTVRVLLEEAFRSNAGIVSPKFVEWEHPDRLLAVGLSVDKTGVPAALVERGELDQEQHDAVRDVFCAPGGCMLVRADLFSSLRGFDPDIDLSGEDLNLSWRSQVAGARVVVAPGVRVRHLEACRIGARAGWDDPGAAQRTAALAEVHRVRTMLTCYGVFHLLRVVPQALVLTLGQAAVELVTARPAAAGASLLAWPRALRDPRHLLAARRLAQRQRTVSDAEVRRLQTGGSAKLRDFFRSTIEGEIHATPASARRRITTQMATVNWRFPVAAWALVVIVMLLGSRKLLGPSLPGVGSIPVLSHGPGAWWRLWWSGWRPDGLGSTASSPPALALLGLSGTILLGAVGVLQKLLVLGPLIIGPLGAYRAARPLASPLGRAAALVTYAAVPLPYNALAGGRWPALVMYAAAPWMVSALCRLGGEAPFAARPHRQARVLGLGVLLALTAAFVPAALFVVPLIGFGLALGSAAVGRLRPGLLALAGSVAASAVAAVLLLPSSIDTLRSRTAVFGVSLGPAGRLHLADIMRFHTGSVGASVVAWGMVVAAALPLLVGRSWRLAWASRLWGVAISCWLAVWASGHGWLPIPMPAPEVFLAPAAAALSLAVGLGAVAFKVDLPGYRLGWRQLALMVAAAGVTLGSVPALAAVASGRWDLPHQDLAGSLGSVFPQPAQGSFRVLWVGDPRALPTGSWWFQDGVGYATSIDGAPDVTSLWPPRSAGATPLVAGDLRLAQGRLTTQLGHLLAPMAVRYIVIPSRTAPAGTGGSAVPVPAGMMAALANQTDLRSLELDAALTVYENAAWAPARAVLPLAADAASRRAGPPARQSAPLAGAAAVLPGRGPDHFAGAVPGAADVLWSATGSGGWHLSVSGHGASWRSAFGWAMAFATPEQGGKASLHFVTPVVRRLLLVLEVAVWLTAVRVLMVDRRRGRRPGGDGGSGVDYSEPPETIVVAPHPRWDPVTVDSDEVWT